MRRRGQAVVLLLALLVAMAALALWIADIDRYVMAKLRVQDGGDASVLAAARWQAAGLNLCGELNLIQAYMLADDVENSDAALALHRLRQNIQLTTPMLGLLAAQTVAEANQLPELTPADEVRDYLRDTARYALFEHYDEPERAASDFREMMEVILRKPIRAIPLTPIYESGETSYLINQDFYEAILAQDWCWFWFYAYEFLQNYRGRGSFGGVPEPNTEPFFGLCLSERTNALNGLEQGNFGMRGVAMDAQLTALGHPVIPPPPDEEEDSPAREERNLQARWTTFNSAQWGPWTAMHRGQLPIDGTLREEYDYHGVSAALSVGCACQSTWMAVAKPFGHVMGQNPTDYELVLGGFDAVRLIPIDAADVGIRGFNLEWLRHLRFHVKSYVTSGMLFDGCRYCSALRTWQDFSFRSQAIEWLAEFGHTCRRPRAGSATDTGGTHYGH